MEKKTARLESSHSHLYVLVDTLKKDVCWHVAVSLITLKCQLSVMVTLITEKETAADIVL